MRERDVEQQKSGEITYQLPIEDLPLQNKSLALKIIVDRGEVPPTCRGEGMSFQQLPKIFRYWRCVC
jgi:hypothetical protein